MASSGNAFNPAGSFHPQSSMTKGFTQHERNGSTNVRTFQLVVVCIDTPRYRNGSTNVRYASACRRSHRHSTLEEWLIRWVIPVQLISDEDNDKLKHIGHSLSHFTGVECTERRRQAEAYRTFVEPFRSGWVVMKTISSC